MKAKYALLVCVLAVGACTDAVMLRHPDTGRTAKCGPYLWDDTVSLAMREAQCIQDFKEQGFVRVPG